MCKRKTRYTLGLIISLVLFIGAVTAFSVSDGPAEPASPEFISAAEAEKITDYRYSDLSPLLSFCGKKAAVDRESSTVYISCDTAAGLSFPQIVSGLRLDSDKLRLCFPEDSYFADISAAVKENHPFRMLAVNEKGRYMEYRLIITTLPVISIEGDEVYTMENGYKASKGSITVWDPADGIYGREPFESRLIWRPRGASSLTMDKKPQKCILLNDRDEERKAEILGMGEDDDWLLNAMRIDDLKLREKLFMSLWNERAAETDYNYPMSQGKYTELIINGSYCGMHFLQRQVEAKLLGLNEGDILIKGKYSPEVQGIEDLYDIKGADKATARAADIFRMLEETELLKNADPDNYLDVAAFLQFASAHDNAGERNMFYIVHSTAAEPFTSLLPWDTDISFGIMWTDRIRYEYELSLQDEILRSEYYALKEKYPELDKLQLERWQELREHILSEEHIFKTLRDIEHELDRSGALMREEERWGLFHGGEDSRENMERYISERLEFLDNYYSEKAS